MDRIIVVRCIVMDPHSFNADPDPEFGADPDPVLDPGI